MNKVKFGLKNVHYAVISEKDGKIEYGIPKFVPGAVTLTQEPSGEPIVFNADDSEYYSEDVNNGYDGTLEMALVPDTFRVDVFGDILDSNGALIENRNAKPKRVALMFEFDGDTNKVRHINYNVKISRPTIESSSHAGATKEVKTESMKFEARPAKDTGDIKAKIEQDKSAYDIFYTAVYQKNAPKNSADKVAYSFKKSAAENMSISIESTDSNNSIRNVSCDGLQIPGVKMSIDGLKITIDKTYIALLAEESHALTVELQKGNTVQVDLTVLA